MSIEGDCKRVSRVDMVLVIFLTGNAELSASFSAEGSAKMEPVVSTVTTLLTLAGYQSCADSMPMGFVNPERSATYFMGSFPARTFTKGSARTVIADTPMNL